MLVNNGKRMLVTHDGVTKTGWLTMVTVTHDGVTKIGWLTMVKGG